MTFRAYTLYQMHDVNMYDALGIHIYQMHEVNTTRTTFRVYTLYQISTPLSLLEKARNREKKFVEVQYDLQKFCRAEAPL